MLSIDDQTTILVHAELRDLLTTSRETNQPIQIDWVNRTIQILSEHKPLIRDGKQVQLSTGPATYRDIFLQLRETPTTE